MPFPWSGIIKTHWTILRLSYPSKKIHHQFHMCQDNCLERESQLQLDTVAVGLEHQLNVFINQFPIILMRGKSPRLNLRLTLPLLTFFTGGVFQARSLIKADALEETSVAGGAHCHVRLGKTCPFRTLSIHFCLAGILKGYIFCFMGP